MMRIWDKEYSTCRNFLLLNHFWFSCLHVLGNFSYTFSSMLKSCLDMYFQVSSRCLSALGVELEISMPQQHLSPSLYNCNFSHYIIHSVMLETLKVCQPGPTVSHSLALWLYDWDVWNSSLPITVFIRSWLLSEQLLWQPPSCPSLPSVHHTVLSTLVDHPHCCVLCTEPCIMANICAYNLRIAVLSPLFYLWLTYTGSVSVMSSMMVVQTSSEPFLVKLLFLFQMSSTDFLIYFFLKQKYKRLFWDIFFKKKRCIRQQRGP